VPLDFAFSEEQEMFRRMVRQFAEKELLPKYAYWDKTDEFPWEISRKMGEVGLTGLRIPEQYGGTNADYVTCGIAAEECARGDFNCTYFVMLAAIAGNCISKYANDEGLKEEWLPRLAQGEITIGLALTEPHCGSDAAALTTTAKRDGDYYVLNGEKSSTSMQEGTAVILYAKTDPSAGPRGVSAFLVPLDTPGLGRSKFNDLGEHAVKRGALHLDNVRIPAKNLLGREGQGFYIVMNEFDYNRAFIALQCIGAAEKTLEETMEYVKTRTAFGQPIARFEGVSFPIAEAATLLEAAKLLSYKALWLRDNNMPHGKEAAMVKWWGPRLAVDVIHQCLLLHGHAGYSDDYLVGQRLRDVIGLEIGDGTAEVMKIIGREFRPY
jgi:cyclohexanecarboxyl-CoA dehydrogenase